MTSQAAARSLQRDRIARSLAAAFASYTIIRNMTYGAATPGERALG